MTFKKVNFYTLVRVSEDEDDDNEISETEDFFSRFENIKEFENDIEILVYWIQKIGAKIGAKEHLFRPEEHANALPPPTKYLRIGAVGKLRLYCIRINNEIVILVNGAEKTANSIQDCPNVLPKFRFANAMGKQITKLILDKELKIEGKNLLEIDGIFLEY